MVRETAAVRARHQARLGWFWPGEPWSALPALTDYLNCFRYGCPPHGGFGLGLGRLLMVLLGLDSLREATFLFRGPKRLRP